MTWPDAYVRSTILLLRTRFTALQLQWRCLCLMNQYQRSEVRFFACDLADHLRPLSQKKAMKIP